MSRVSKGPPPQYRWLAWTTITNKRLKSAKGLYQELIIKGKESVWVGDIKKDLDRTFPNHQFFQLGLFDNAGQQAMQNVL